MAKGKAIVVDASVARAAGGREHPTSKRCTDFLLAMRDDTEHTLVITRSIMVEWRKHASVFASTWQRNMIARKRHTPIRDDDIANKELHELIDTHAKTDKARAEMFKDVHLLEAALKADNIITSLNDKDRDRFIELCHVAVMIRAVMWVNPDTEGAACITWLVNGAEDEPARQLGYDAE